MARLKSALLSKYSSQRDRVKIYNPRNCDELRLYFKGEKVAKVASFNMLANPRSLDPWLIIRPKQIKF